jgi:SMODS domain-containing protein/adenylyl/guanylyl cyclase-like protein with sensor domain
LRGSAMKHVNKLNEFMVNTVNLNQSRIDTLTTRVDVVDRFLKNDTVFGEIYIETGLQGSYAHKTIIKPSSKSPEFDADLILYLTEKEDWEPKDYIEELFKRFKENSNYKNIVCRGTRCVTLDYAGEFHLDVVPCIKRDTLWSGETFHICNRNENIVEKTNPIGYTQWLQDKNSEVENNNLIKTIRIIKYLRDIKQTFSCKSILLTTLIANQVGGFEGLFDDYVDLPTTLKIIINNLNSYLQDNEVMPIVSNPVDEEEDFNRHWNQDKYANFRTQIKKYNDWINDAFDEGEQEESIKKWQKIFGEEFGAASTHKSSSIREAASSQDTNFPIPAYVESPPWKILRSIVNPKIKVTIHKANDGSPAIAEMSKNIIGSPVGKNLKVRMEYLGGVSNGFSLYWQIVNTGDEAIGAGDMRGKIVYGGDVRWEDTRYKGVHWVECFIVDDKRKVCTGRSGRYFVHVG